MAKRIVGSTLKQDGFRMPGEFEPQEKVWMIWPERPDNWRDGGKPVQEAFTNVAKAISQFTPMNVVVFNNNFKIAVANCRQKLRFTKCQTMMPGFVIVDHHLSLTTMEKSVVWIGHSMLGGD